MNKILLPLLLCVSLIGCATTPINNHTGKPITKNDIPPTFFPAIATYRDKRFISMLVGSTRFLSCKEALEDSAVSIAKVTEFMPATGKAVGMCIPVPTFDVEDLIPDPDIPTIKQVPDDATRGKL